VGLSGPRCGHDASGMMGRTKESWRRSQASKPGHRFQERYRRHQESTAGATPEGFPIWSAGSSSRSAASFWGAPWSGHANILPGLGHDRRRVPSRRPAPGLGGGEGKEARSVGQRYLGIIRRRESLSRVGGRHLRRRAALRGLPLAVQRLTP
jgi:hypothetical protein